MTQPEPFETLSSTASGRRVPSAWQRALGSPHLQVIGRERKGLSWSFSIGITVVAFLLRLWHLGTPNVFEYDETYYAKDAWSMLHFGFARNWTSNANDLIVAGHANLAKLTTNTPEEIVHPEFGKWLIGAGEAIFGFNSFGWRISSAVIGSLMILLIIRFVRRVTGSMLLGAVAGILMTFDGLEFVLSRLALLDLYAAFFMLLAVHCMVIDRDWYRARLARLVPEPITDGSFGPVRRLLFRPWLLVSGVVWGLALGTKWDPVYPLAAFAVLYVAWCAGARRSFGVRWAWAKALLADGLTAFVHLIVVALLVFVGTWTGWLIHHRQYEEHLSATQYTQYVGGGGKCVGSTFTPYHPDPKAEWPTAKEPDRHGVAGVVQAIESLAYYERDIYVFSTYFLNCTTHTYGSNPAGWPLLNRPVGVAALNGIAPGAKNGGVCDAASGSTCLRQVLLLGTPVLWWGGALALLCCAFFWIALRDWRAGMAVVGALVTWLPWLPFDQRPIFSYYTISMLPFEILAIALVIGRLIGSSAIATVRRTVGVSISGAFVVLVMVNFAWFWPVYTYGLLSRSDWLARIWFLRWI